MSPPRHISHSLLLPTTGLQVNMSSKPSEAYHYYRSPCHHPAIYRIFYYYLLQVYRSTRCQNPQNHTNTTGHHVTTSPYILFSTTTYYRSTGQHVVKTPRIIPIPQVTMSPPRHISYSLLLPTTGLQVNTSSKSSESIHYYRSPCPHPAIYFILYYYLLQVYRSTRRQNPQNHTITTGHHVPTSPYLILYYYYLLQVHRSTRRQSSKNHTLLQVNMSPPRHISHSLLLPTTGLQVNTSSKPSEAYQYHRSPCHHLAIYLILYCYLLQVYRSTRRQNLRSIPIPQVTMSPPRHISYSPLLPTTGLQVNTSSKPSEAYQYHRSPCHHLAIYLILYYYLPQVYRSTRRQNPQKHTITTGHHVPTSPYISFSTTTYYRSTGQHVLKTPRIIPLLQVTMSHLTISNSLLLPTTGPQVNMSSKPSESIHYYRSPCHRLAISHPLLPPTTGPQVNMLSKT